MSHDPVVSSDVLNQASVCKRVLIYMSFVLASGMIVVTGLRLDEVDLSVPFNYQGDSLLILPMVQSLKEHGTHWQTARMGYPGELQLYDFPVIDHLHFGILWLLIQASGNAVVAFNLYHLLTYPLTTLFALWAFRTVGLRWASAGGAALLYTFLPYHQVRGTGHYFLSAYFLVPPVMAWCQLLVMKQAKWHTLDRAAWWRYFLAALVSCAGAYYAFFSCLLLSFSGVYAAILQRKIQVFLPVALLIGVIVAGGVLNHLPTYQFHATHGKHTMPTDRLACEAELFALKFTQMVLPIPQHRLEWLGDIGQRYDHPLRPVQNENNASPLGLLGTIGFLWAFLAVLLPHDRWQVRPVALLILFAFFYGTMGGLGSLFNFVVTPQVRGVDRISIFLAFPCLYLVFHLLERFYLNSKTWLRCFYLPGMLFWTAFGLADQTEYRWFTPQIIAARAEIRRAWQDDKEFFQSMERVCPGGAVFTLPYVYFPEAYLEGEFTGNSHARGYLHTTSLRFSFGAMKYREIDQLHRELAASPVQVMCERLVLHDFDLLLIDERGYLPEHSQPLLAECQQLLGEPVCISKDGKQFVFDLRRYKEHQKQQLGEARYELAKRIETHRVRMIWLAGCFNFEPLGREAMHIWVQKRGLACLINPSDHARLIKLSIVFQTPSEFHTKLSIDAGELWHEQLSIFQRSDRCERTLLLPPGRTFVRLECKPPKDWKPTDERRLVFYAAQIQIQELEI